jgi:hypothetical protein
VKILFDINVVLDVLLNRQPFVDDSVRLVGMSKSCGAKTVGEDAGISSPIDRQAQEFFESVRVILAEARHSAYSRVNRVMIEAYWRVGRRIVEEEQKGASRAGYGESLLQGLSRTLSEEYGKGFSYANLRNFRQFYLTWPDWEKCYTLCSKLSWSHNRLIMREETVVRYSVLKDREQLFASKYLHVLPSEEELAHELEARHVLDIEVREG